MRLVAKCSSFSVSLNSSRIHDMFHNNKKLAVFGGLIELLARLLMVGMTNASMWLAKDFNLDNWTSETSNDGTGWRVLEMIHTVTHGRWRISLILLPSVFVACFASN